MLCVYLKDASIEIDNTTVERAICPTAIAKKNWLLIGGLRKVSAAR